MSWSVVVPFKGAPASKSRLAAQFSDEQRAALARAFLQDAVAAVRAVPTVARVLIVSGDAGIAELFADAASLGSSGSLAPVEVLPDPVAGLNAAVAAGIAAARERDASAGAVAMLGDLPELTSSEFAAALDLAARHPLAFVPDAAGTGSTMILLAPGSVAEPHFGAGSAAAHAAGGFVTLTVTASSGLRRDVDSPVDLQALRTPGPHTAAVLEALAAV